MHDDDEILETYEHEFEFDAEPAPRRSNRGFWLVAGSILVGSIVLVVEIFANRPIANTIGHAQFDLRAAQTGRPWRSAARPVRSREPTPTA